MAYLKNPVLKAVARLLVWDQAGKTFTITPAGLADSEGQAYTLTDQPVRVAHPMDMAPGDVRAWQRYFTSHSLKQPFIQIWEPVIDLKNVKENRYAGCMIPYYRFLHQEKYGIKVDDWDYHNEIDISFQDCRAKVERIDFMRHMINMDDRFEIKSFKVYSANRMTNHIVAYLDRVTIIGRIRKDDVTIVQQLPDFTLAQLMEFIQTAQESNATQVLALLLDLKNKTYAGLDPLDEFTLN